MISCLCFSEDNPMQLEAYILSLRECSGDLIDLSVLFKAGREEYKEAYLKLENNFPEVKFFSEENFRRQVSKWLKSTKDTLVMFGTDDVVFKEKIDKDTIIEAFNNPDIYCFSLGLGLEIMYSAEEKKTIARPMFIQDSPFLLWNWRESGGSWKHAFNLKFGIYRKVFVEKIFELLDSNSVSHPEWKDIPSSLWNSRERLQGFGSILAKNINAFPLMASFRSSAGVAVTLNGVCTEDNGSIVSSPDKTSNRKKLLDMWNGGIVFDTREYYGKKYRSDSVGDILLCKKEKSEEKIDCSSYDVFKDMIIDFANNVPGFDKRLRENPRFPDYIKEFDEYFHMQGAEVELPVGFLPCLKDKTDTTHIDREYFYQDTWCFSRVAAASPSRIVDVGSTVLLVGIMSYLAPTESIDIRPLEVKLPGLSSRKGSITELPFEDKSVELLTSMCVIEHIGLGRYGDTLDPMGSVKAFSEISRVIKPGGRFIGSVPISREPFVSFNANRAFRKDDVLGFFPDFELKAEQFLYPDPGPGENVEKFHDFEYCTWCFELQRKQQ